MQTLPLNEISSSKIQNNTKIIQNDKQAIKWGLQKNFLCKFEI